MKKAGISVVKPAHTRSAANKIIELENKHCGLSADQERKRNIEHSQVYTVDSDCYVVMQLMSVLAGPCHV